MHNDKIDLLGLRFYLPMVSQRAHINYNDSAGNAETM